MYMYKDILFLFCFLDEDMMTWGIITLSVEI